MYKIRYSKDATKQVQIVIPKKYAELILKSVSEKLSAEPFLYGIPLKGDWKGCYKLRVGKYRIVYQILQDEQIVDVVAIDHRKQVYRSFLLI